MANSKAISIRVPDELLDKIDKLAEDKYKSHKGTPNRSLVVLDAIVAYFDALSDIANINEAVLVSDSVSIVEFNGLRDIVDTLSNTVKKLEKQLLIMSDSVEILDENPKQGQLDIVTLSDSVMILNATQLAKRLEVPISMITKYKNTSDLLDWSKGKDPDSIAWSYDSVIKKFSPASLSEQEGRGTPFSQPEGLAPLPTR
jgi:metal-responsive CopG/Arc/MetJ family transcriptional regulator